MNDNTHNNTREFRDSDVAGMAVVISASDEALSAEPNFVGCLATRESERMNRELFRNTTE